MPDPSGPVFFDSSGKRSVLVSTIKATAYFLAAFLITFLLVNVIVAPTLPALKLSDSPSQFGPAFRPFEKAEAAEPPVEWRRHRSATPLAAGGGKRYAFFANWDDKSFSSLKQHYEDIDVLMPTWLHLDGSVGDFTHDDPVKEEMVLDWIYGTSGNSDGEVAISERSVLSWLRGHAPSLSVMPVVDNFNPESDRWDGAATDALLASPASRTALIDRLENYVKSERFAGLVLDLEQTSAAQKANFLAFVNELAQRLHGHDKQLVVNVPADEVLDTKGLAATEADYVLLSAFDEHTDEAGPLAGQGWFESVLDRAFADIGDSRLIVAVGSYAYDWSEKGERDEISVAEAWSRAHESGATIDFEDDSLNPTFSYTNVGDGALHKIWFLDGVTAWNQEAAALAMNPGGIALYRLGAEDESVWKIFGRSLAPDPVKLDTLKNPEAGPSIIYRGQGEVLRVTALEKPGVRSLEYDPASNLITDEKMTTLPRPTTITRWGLRHDKVIALTFDDGPLDVYTPAILDVLAKEGVKATFFVIGQNAALKPDLLRRIYDEGHDIGNHTFSHPNIALLPAKQVEMELTATQRVLEAKLGVQTILWRPPFTEDMEPIAADDAYSLIEAGRLGYTTIGLHIDPYDWARPGTEEIVRRTVSFVEEGQGNVVLLHDGGGNRQETVDALPQIIDQLKSKGYRFVTTHELLGLERSAVMPTVPVSELWASNVNDVAFSVWREANTLLGMLFIIGIVLGTLRLVPIVVGAVMQSRRARRRDDTDWSPEHFAVLIPAFNEQTVICKSIQALLDSTVTNFDIILVDDGSTDDTAAVVRAAFAGNRRVRVYKKANGGKASAVNFALKHTRADIVVTLDADTLFEPDALRLLVRHFREPTVGAVAGAALVGNRVSWIAQFQALEYVTSQNLDRRAMEMANAIPVVPGAIGAWRRLAIRAIGGFAGDTLAEDADATIHIERAGWRVFYEPRAMARTEAPETLRDFFKQRFRWMFGMLQAAFKHRGVYREPGAFGVKAFTLPNIFLFQFLFPLVSPVMDLVLLWTVFASIWGQTMHETSGLSPGAIEVFIFWAAFQTLELVVAAIALLLDRHGGWWRLLPLVVVQRFCYRQLLYWVAIRSTGAAVRGRLVSWSKLLRTGRVQAAPLSSPPSEIGAKVSQEAA